MPSDNLEKYFKERIEAVQHKPLPDNSWEPEVAWQQLQQTLPNQTQPLTKQLHPVWLAYAAAVWAIVLFSGLAFWYIADLNKISTNVAKLPANVVAPVAGNITANNQAATKTKMPSPTMPQPELYPKASKKYSMKAARAKQIAVLPPASQPPAPPHFNQQPVPTVPASNLDSSTVPNTMAANGAVNRGTTKPLKITVVLGAPTLARNQPALIFKPAVATQKKIRLRIHSPNNQLTEEVQLATARANSASLPLGAKIEF